MHAVADNRAMRQATASMPRSQTRRDVLAWLGAAAWSAPSMAAQAAGPHQAQTRVVVLSDFNGSYGSTAYDQSVDVAVRRTIALRPDLVISTGDMVAGQRVQTLLARDQLVAMWDAFHRHVTTPLLQAGLPLAVTPGNHDGSSGARFALEREVYRAQWLQRRPALDFVAAGGYPFDYAFRLGANLFVAIDATFVGPLSPTQRAWVERVLHEGGRDAAQRVVFSHVPLWPFAHGRERDYLGDRQLESVLQREHVGVYLSGHHHAYYPGFKDGVRYVSQGCLGAAPRALIGQKSPHERTITVLDLQADGVARIEAYGGAAFDRPVSRESLPREVRSSVATLLRDDLAPPTGPR
jgi:3',5'-cyclic AMP phosphodiesterase CpdA